MSEIPQILVKKYFEINPDFSGRRICISALPGIGMAGKTAVDHLIDELNPEIYAEIYTTDFPSHILINSDGSIITFNVTIYYYKSENNHDLELFFVTGDTQPNSYIGTNSLSDKIVEVLVESGVNLIISLAATPVFSPRDDPQVFLTFTSETLFQEFLDAGVKNKFVKGTITGMNGVIPGIAKTYSIGGVILLTETFPQFVRDMKASAALIKILNNYLDLNIDISDLELQAQKTKDLYDKVRQRQKEKRTRKDSPDLGYIS